MDDAESLRTRAEQCRRLAHSILHRETVRSLEDLAREYEQRAEAMEREIGGRCPTAD